MDIKTVLIESLKSRKFQYSIVALAFVAVLPLFVRSPYIVGQVFTVMIIFALYASSWNLLAYSGQGSLGHAAFLGIGGFTSALLAIRLGLPPVVGLFIGGLLSAVIATMELTQVKGIGEKRAAQLKALGINSVDDLSKASAKTIAKELKISPKIVDKWIDSAKELVD